MLTQTTRMLDTKWATPPEPRTLILNTHGTTTAYLRLLQPPAVRRALS
jgi:hypothetical protein